MFYLHFILRQVQSETSSHILSEAQVPDEADEPIQYDHSAHGHVEYPGAAQEVVRFQHLVFNGHHHADAFHGEQTCAAKKKHKF